MFELSKISRPLFIEMMNDWLRSKNGLDEIWTVINNVKKVPAIPGLNILTIYQIAEYFEISQKGVKRASSRFDYSSRKKMTLYHMGANTLKEFALDWETIQTPEGKRIKIEYINFSTIVPPSGIICYSAIHIIDFIYNIVASEVCSRIIEALIRYAATKRNTASVIKNADILFELLPNKKVNYIQNIGEEKFVSMARKAYRDTVSEEKGNENNVNILKIILEN